MTRILVAVTLPRHPTTGNVYRARAEAAALAIALSSGAEVEVVHVAAETQAEPLRSFAGYGARLTWIVSADPLAALMAQAHALRASAILTGTASERGLGSGLLPHALAHRLGCSLLSDLRTLRREGGAWHCETGLAHGRRALWRSEGTLVATVSPRAGLLRAPSFTLARGQDVDVIHRDDAPAPEPNLVPGGRRATAIGAPGTGEYDARLRALMQQAGASAEGRVLDGSPEALANAFLDELRRAGLADRNQRP